MTPIFNAADLGIVGDVHKIVPILTEKTPEVKIGNEPGVCSIILFPFLLVTVARGKIFKSKSISWH